MAESKVFDVKFHFSMSKSPWGQVLSRFHWIGDGFIRGRSFKQVFLKFVHGVKHHIKTRRSRRSDPGPSPAPTALILLTYSFPFGLPGQAQPRGACPSPGQTAARSISRMGSDLGGVKSAKLFATKLIYIYIYILAWTCRFTAT